MSDYFGKNTPKLGFGLMRLPKLEDGSIDVEQTKVMVDKFMAAGLTYFDTAYVYPGSEEAAREAARARQAEEAAREEARPRQAEATTSSEATHETDRQEAADFGRAASGDQEDARR